MTKFLGVISNSAPRPSDDRVLEYTDLDLLANFLFSETQNLFNEFQQKMQFFNEQEIAIHDSLTKLTEIYELYKILKQKSIEIERETDEVGFWLCKMDNSINCMERLPKDFAGCKCTSNSERTNIFNMLVKLSEDSIVIGSQVGLVEELDRAMPVKESCDFNSKLLLFLDLHTKILENIEQKIDMISDMSKRVDEMFINARKRLAGACYHKPRHDYSSDC